MENVSVGDIKEFFFEASLKGYVNEEIPKTTIPELPGSKVYRYEKGDLVYVDLYFVDDSGKSLGSTLIWYKGKPVWYMQYSGFCSDKKVILFLKRALGRAYRTESFVGGRGTEIYVEDSLIYDNHSVHSIYDFRSFSGFETIYERVETQREALLFRHDYSGRMLMAET